MLNSFTSILSFDIRAIARDRFLLLVILMVTLLFSGLSLLGFMREEIGAEHFQPWIAYLLIMAIIANPASFGMVFGVFLIEEVETKVRAALMTTPFPPVLLLLMRTPLLIIILTVMGLVSGIVMSAAWGVNALSFFQWFAIAVSGAVIGVPIMVSISTFATNRIEAMAIGKFYSAFVIPPILMYLIPLDAWYRVLFLIFPTAPTVHAYEAFRQGSDLIGYLWLLLGFAYTAALTALSVKRYLKKSYGVI